MASEWTKRLATLFAGLFVGLVAVETGVRLVEPREVIREYFETPDPVLHHKFIAGARGRHKTAEFDATYSINSLGLRDREITRGKPAGVRRILMLGDSFTEGIGVEAWDTFSSRLQALLDEAGHGPRWQAINAGVGSYSPLIEYLYLKNGGLDLQPDLVILNFDLSDVYDDVQYTRLAVFDARGEPLAVRAEPGPERAWPVELLVDVKDFFKRHTRAYNFLRRRVGSHVEALRHRRNFTGDVRLDKYAMLRGNGSADAGWELTHGYLLRIRDLLAAHGADFWVALYPYGHQVSPHEWGSGRRFWGFEPGRVYPLDPQRHMEDFCRRNGIPVVNMCADFQEASAEIYPLYAEHDGHWRPAGHRVAARALFRAVAPYVGAAPPAAAETAEAVEAAEAAERRAAR